MSRMLKYILCVLVALFAFTTISIGDVGDFSDYDSDSGWSDSSSDSWGDSSDSWDSGSSSGGHSGNPLTMLQIMWESGPIGKGLLIWGLIVVILSFLPKRKLAELPDKKDWPDLNNISYRSKQTPSLPVAGKWPGIPDHTTDITRVLQETDPAFNAVAFLEWAKEVFFKLQYAWMDRDWEQARPFESPELYATHERQLQEYKRLGRINILERININSAYFFSLVKDRDWETLSVVMNVRMIDYIVDEHTREVLKGTPGKDCFMSYFYVFKRKAGVKTLSAKQEVDTIACPNCGAPTHVVSSGKCEYCNFVITVKDHGWVLADIIGIKPPYNYGSGGIIMQGKPGE